MGKSNFDFLKDYGQLQYQIMFDRFIDLGFATVSYSQSDSYEFWNYALTSQLLSVKQLSVIEATFGSLHRKSTICFENCSELKPLNNLLQDNGYLPKFEDSWMFHPGTDLDSSKFKSVKKVENETDLKVFIHTFDSCYQKNDPQNFYGELGGYLDITYKVWQQYHTTNRLEYFIVFHQDQPVAVSTLTNFNGLGYISNVGSLKSFRGQGFGKTATLYCISQSIKNGNTLHFLATEEGTYPHEFYKRIGFVPKFTAKALTKE